MSLIYAYQNRGLSRNITITDANGDTIIPSSGDKIRVVIGREGKLGSDLSGAKLVVTSDGATANGSSFAKNSVSSGTHRLRLDASDLAFGPGVYTLFVDYFDSNDASEWKNCDRQVFCLEATE